MSLVYSSGIDSIVEHNKSFDRGVLRVCYTGRNRNNSFIGKDVFERCIGSIYNCPVVCRYDRDSDTIGGHDMEVVRDCDNVVRMVNKTHPVGVVPQGGRYWWEEIEDNSGVHEYLCVDVILWKRQEAYRKIKEDGIVDESMEINIKSGEMIDGVYVIHDFEFTAFCLLGTVEPCYESASLEVFSKADFDSQFAQMMHEYKETFSLVHSPFQGGVDICPQNYSEGGTGILDEKNMLMTEFGIAPEAIDFRLEDFTLGELREKFAAIKAVRADDDDAEESADGDGVPEDPVEEGPQDLHEDKQDDRPSDDIHDDLADDVDDDASSEGSDNSEEFSLQSQFFECLMESLETELVETCWGEMPRYWYVDYDAEASEVYAYDTEDWKLYGFTFAVTGDVVSVDFASKKRKKFAIVDFDGGEQTAFFAANFDKLTTAYAKNDAAWAERYQASQDELKDLRDFKLGIEVAETEAEFALVFEGFHDLDGIDAFEELRVNHSDYTIGTLEEKCYAIRGRCGTAAKFSFEQKAPKLKVARPDETDEPYGGVFKRFGIS